jgi:hypothetical protein
MAQLDDAIDSVTAAGLAPVTIVLSYRDHWSLSYHDLGGPGVGYPRPSVCHTFVPSYRNLPIICPGLGHHEPPIIGVSPQDASAEDNEK